MVVKAYAHSKNLFIKKYLTVDQVRTTLNKKLIIQKRKLMSQ